MRLIIGTILICFSINFTYALGSPPDAFNIKLANKQFDHITLQLSVQNLNINNLNAAANHLSKLTVKAEQCIDEVQKKINNTTILIQQGSSATDNAKKEGADLIYLNNQQKILAAEQAQCRLFNIRAKEALNAYKTTIAQLKQTEALTRGMPLWKIINNVIHEFPKAQFENIFNAQILIALPSAWYCMISIISASLTAAVLLLRARKGKMARSYAKLKRFHFSYLILLTSFFLASTLLIYAFTQDLYNSDPILILSKLIFFYLLTFISIIIAANTKTIKTLFCWYSIDRIFLQNLIISLLSFYALIQSAGIFSDYFLADSPLWQLLKSIYILAILTTCASFISYFCKIHRHMRLIKHHHSFIKRSSNTIFISCAIINILGYHTMAQHLTFSGLISCGIIFMGIFTSYNINKYYLTLNLQPNIKLKIIKYFGYRSDQIFVEFLILKIIAQLIVALLSVYLIGESWGFATDLIDIIYSKFLNGIHIVNLTFYPTRIILGAVVFCLLYLVSRYISTAMKRHQQFEDEEDTQVAVASILTYIGFSLALIAGLLVSGFDFTGLAIIAGALSVGIGLGLQSIVNNFVSGLILLIEKPIRPGDRINVDGVEGFVKKIRVRSTQIITPSRDDIIVPNSDLITRRVTNYMFSDKFCKINCDIHVAYGSDTQLVRELLMLLASHHEEVVKTGRNKPIVLFRAFTDSALLFQLTCLIKDVNKKALVQSDLNFAIDNSFRQHKINMPFPQRELHIKLDGKLQPDSSPLS